MTDQIALSLTCSRLRVAPVVGFNHTVPWDGCAFISTISTSSLRVSRVAEWTAILTESKSRHIARRIEAPLTPRPWTSCSAFVVSRQREGRHPHRGPSSTLASRESNPDGPSTSALHAHACAARWGAQRWGSCSDPPPNPPPKLGVRVPCWSCLGRDAALGARVALPPTHLAGYQHGQWQSALVLPRASYITIKVARAPGCDSCPA